MSYILLTKLEIFIYIFVFAVKCMIFYHKQITENKSRSRLIVYGQLIQHLFGKLKTYGSSGS